MRAARALGLSVHDRSEELGIDLVVYGHGEQRIPVLEGRYDDQLRARDFFLTEDKYATKVLLDEAGFTTPSGFVFTYDGAGDAALTEALTQLDRNPVVLKPRAGMRGNAVFTDLCTAEDIVAHMADQQQHFRDWLIEEQIEGPDLRLQIIGDELVAACVRKPAGVTGDGQHSLGELIDRHRAKVKNANPSSALVLDSETESLLADQELGLADVPAAGRIVQLKKTANMAKGGTAVDVTDALHPDFSKWASAVAKLFDAKILAIDAVCAAPHEPPEGNVTVLEVNAAPEWVHHTFSENRTHDIATRILRYWFGL